MILVVSSGGYMLVRRSLKPVEDIRATAEQITFGNLSNRLPVVHTGDALENLSLTLNQMLERLDYAYQQASRFSADASHELRTPLAIVRAELESMIREPMSEALRERIGSILEESERLTRITESLFAISRMDAGEAKIDHVWFNLSELVKSTAEQMMLLATEKKINFNVTKSEFVPILGDPARIKQVVVNLLDNAIKYTPEGGSISIKIFHAEKKAILEIIDNGVGISSDALPHVFERFYRADQAKMRELGGGAGLGLSIVRSICHAHGGNVEIESIYGCGTTCWVELPLAANVNGKSKGYNVAA
jgi:signal transduction histidine kinase